MTTNDLPDDFVEKCKAITAKRPRTVIDHILTYGFITTEELKDKYGYNHPPRAARDVREQGIPLETFRVTGSDGRKIGAYRFGNPARARFSKLSGRTGFPGRLRPCGNAASASGGHHVDRGGSLRLRPTEEANPGASEGHPRIHQGDHRETRIDVSHPRRGSRPLRAAAVLPSGRT